MKDKRKTLLVCLLALAMMLAMTACGGSNQGDSSTEDTTKQEETGTDDSNVSLKDDQEEAKYQIEVAMQKQLEEAYGDKVNDARIYVDKIYTAKEEQESEALKSYDLSPDEVAFEVHYELHPAEGTDVNELLAGNGEYDEESGWVIEKYNVGILRPAEDGSYTITDFGTGW